MAAKKTKGESLDGVSLTCNGCVATANTPSLDVTGARAYVAAKWKWIVTPSGHDLCPLCVKRGELETAEHTPPKPKRRK